VTRRIEDADSEAARLLAGLAEDDLGAVDPVGWSRRSVVAARPLLEAHARSDYRRRVGAALGAALVPLPLIALYARAVFGWLYDLAGSVLPAPFPALAVGGYAATTSLLLALTYAAIPVLVERTQSWRFAR
jgi:hypothetical protein